MAEDKYCPGNQNKYTSEKIKDEKLPEWTKATVDDHRVLNSIVVFLLMDFLVLFCFETLPFNILKISRLKFPFRITQAAFISVFTSLLFARIACITFTKSNKNS